MAAATTSATAAARSVEAAAATTALLLAPSTKPTLVASEPPIAMSLELLLAVPPTTTAPSAPTVSVSTRLSYGRATRTSLRLWAILTAVAVLTASTLRTGSGGRTSLVRLRAGAMAAASTTPATSRATLPIESIGAFRAIVWPRFRPELGPGLWSRFCSRLNTRGRRNRCRNGGWGLRLGGA